MRVGTNGRSTWVTMGPLGWTVWALCIAPTYYVLKYTLLGMWWLLVLGPLKLCQAVQRSHQLGVEQAVAQEQGERVLDQQRQAAKNRADAIGPWPGASSHRMTGPRDWSSHQ